MGNLIKQRVALARLGQNPFVICRMASGWPVVGDVQPLPGRIERIEAFDNGDGYVSMAAVSSRAKVPLSLTKRACAVSDLAAERLKHSLAGWHP
jgi:hypothetical protein